MAIDADSSTTQCASVLERVGAECDTSVGMTRRRLAFAALGVIALLLVFARLTRRETRHTTTPSANESASAPASTGTLSVQVSSEKKPVAAAKVGVITSRGGIEDLAAGAITSASGHVQLTGLPLGRQRLIVTHPSYRRVEREVEVTAAETRIVIELESGGEIRVSVVGPSNQSIAEAKVGLRRGDVELRTGETNASGTFEFAGLDPGEYVVHVVAARFRAKDSAKLTLVDRGRVEERVQLEEGRTIAGRVRDEAGAPLGEVSVGSSDVSGAIAVTDAEGRYELAGLGEGRVNLFATKDGYAPRQLRGIATGGRNIDLTLERPASVEGVIVRKGGPRSLMVSACQRDAHFEKEICVARLQILPDATSFLLESLPSGNYELVLEGEGQRTERVRFTARAGEKVSVGSVTLRSQ
jgi:hypothetical protein